LRTLRRDRPTVVPLVPAAIQLMLSTADFSEDDYSSIKSILYFGSPIGRELLNLALKKLRCELNQYYGTTETWFLTVLNHKQHLSGSEGRLASCGEPLPLVSMKVVDAKGNEVPNGTVGEILVRTPVVFAGYFKQPTVTASVLKDGWYCTGDLGRRDDDGFYYLVDRAKDMIITGGENVYSAEVEGALLKHPAVATIAVIGTPDPKWGEKVTALVVLAANAKADESELKQHCRKYLAGYKVPKDILFETSLPMTPTGKVQKAVLRQRFRS
jgi:acyl-CoA synthetase (AMP-forming)/AMP-acid ligase II